MLRGSKVCQWCSLALIAGVLILAGSTLGAESHPETMEVGGTKLVLSGSGTRTKLFFIELYSIALYLPEPMSEPERIQSVQIPKALRLQVRYDGSLPDKIPAAWREELVPILTPEQMQTLKTAYRRLNQGDIIAITYAPGSGSAVRVGDHTVLSDPGPKLMNAFLDIWLGKNPVSQELKNALL